MLDMVTPMTAEWVRIAKLKYGNRIPGLGDDNIYIFIDPCVSKNTSVASFGFMVDPTKPRFLYRIVVNPYWAYMMPEDTIRQVIGHEIAHYVHFKFDCYDIGNMAAVKKWEQSILPDGDGGHNSGFSSICATLGVAERVARAYYIATIHDAIVGTIKEKILKYGLGTFILDTHHLEYMRKNTIKF